VSDTSAGPRTPVELIRGLALLAEPPSGRHETVWSALGLSDVPTSAQYSDVFLFQLYPYASVYLGSEGMMGGDARSRIAGFWRALGYDPPAEPDHVSSLLGLYATLAERERETDGAESVLIAGSRTALLTEHLVPWIFVYLSRAVELVDGAYGSWARLLRDVLRREVEAVTPPAHRREAPPVHLREAPGLPDPRVEGAGAFLSGILTPIRSGLVLTRADLARLSSALDLGLRAGERRYALEHLLAQDPPAVLDALADEAERQRRLHLGSLGWLGSIMGWWGERCASTAALLAALAADGRADEVASSRRADEVASGRRADDVATGRPTDDAAPGPVRDCGSLAR